jgi:SAM-dependent methyltransferase
MSEKFNCKSYGYDIAETTIIRLIEHVKDRSIKNVYFEILNLNENLDRVAQFDLITSFGVIEHFENPVPMLVNLRKLLTNDGVLFLSVPNVYSLHTILRPLAQVLGVWRIGYERSYTPSSLKRLMEDVGFEIIESNVLPSYDLFGTKLSTVFPFLKKLSYRIESMNLGIGFVTSVVARKKSNSVAS